MPASADRRQQIVLALQRRVEDWSNAFQAVQGDRVLRELSDSERMHIVNILVHQTWEEIHDSPGIREMAMALNSQQDELRRFMEQTRAAVESIAQAAKANADRLESLEAQHAGRE